MNNIQEAQVIFEELAKLDELEYERVYKDKAKELEVST